MTGKAAFSEEEWELVREGPPAAGFLALSASGGGSFRESWAIAKVYAEARKEHGASELLDDVVGERPKAKRYGSAQEAELDGLRRLGEAVALLEQKATPAEVEAYKRFTLDVASRAAEAHKEKAEAGKVSDAEQAAIDKIATAMNAG